MSDYKARVLIGTPTYDGRVQAQHAHCLVSAAQHAIQHDIAVASMVIQDCPFIDMARNILVAEFLKTDFSHLIFIDSDVGIPVEAITTLVSADLPITAGATAKRGKPGKYHIKTGEKRLGDWIEVEQISTSCLCIRRDVLEHCSEIAHPCQSSLTDYPVPTLFRVVLETPKLVGEDIYFCQQYRMLYDNGTFEHPIWMYPDLTINHDGEASNFAKSLREAQK